MKTITEYQCEICRQRYSTQERAEACEAQGYPNPNEWPAGLLEYHDFSYNGRYGIFCLAKTNSYFIHRLSGSYWACRSWSLMSEGGDNFDDEYCGDHGEISRKRFDNSIKPEHLELPEMKRMLDYLASKDITPMVMLDGKIIPLADAFKPLDYGSAS